MKRPAALLVFICLATTVFAADTQRYLIGTKRPVKAGAIAALRANVDVEPRNVAAFESFDGFAAELTAGEAEALRKSGEIRWIEPVVERNAYLTGRNPTKQSVPYGIKQVGAIAAHQTRKSGDVNVVQFGRVVWTAAGLSDGAADGDGATVGAGVPGPPTDEFDLEPRK